MGNNVKILGCRGENYSLAAVSRAHISRTFRHARRRGVLDSAPQKRSEGETNTDCRSNVAGINIRNAGTMRNGDGQTSAHEGIRNSDVTVETFGEVIVRVERRLIKIARAGTAETSCAATGRRNTEGVLPLLIPGPSDVGFFAVSVFRARPPDLHQLLGIKIVVFDSAQDITA